MGSERPANDLTDAKHFVIVFSRTRSGELVRGQPQRAGSFEQAEFVAKKRAVLRWNCGSVVIRAKGLSTDHKLIAPEIVLTLGEVDTERLFET